jgi:hypothetical protein
VKSIKWSELSFFFKKKDSSLKSKSKSKKKNKTKNNFIPIIQQMIKQQEKKTILKMS